MAYICKKKTFGRRKPKFIRKRFGKRMVFRIVRTKMDMNSLLAKETVRMRSREETTQVLKKFVNAGAGCLQVITDFDHTISKSKTATGELNCTTHRVFHAVANGVDPTLRAALSDLTDKYYPIEMNPSMSNEEKVPHMEQWWTTSHSLLVKAGIKKTMLEQFIRDAKLELRDGFLEFLRLAEADGIPIVIFSAGIGDVIQIVLQQQYGRIPTNVHIISNMMKFDEAGVIVGFLPPLIHTFNKNVSVIQGERTFFEHLKGRPNVLMLGDTLGDLHMDVGVVNERSIVKLGFLNHFIEKNLPAYLAGYDIVLTDDQTFELPLGLLKNLIRHEHAAS